MCEAVVLYGIIVILVCMQNWKEKASELGQWKIKGVPILYPILFITLLIPILFWNVENIRCFDDFTIADNSARYLLSALVQSLAAIIAIVVTMTLVAVQFTASAYSPRVIDIFKKDWVMWLLLVWYGLLIFFGLFVLETIGGKYQNLSHWSVSLEFCVFLAYSMGVAAFAGLFWHIGNVINLLKPENIINRLSENMAKENISKYIKSLDEHKAGRTRPIEVDPVQPIEDIICSSLSKHDFTTIRSGINVITNRAIDVMDQNEYKISEYFCGHLERIGKLAVNSGDDESAAEGIKNWGDVLKEMAGEKYDLISHIDILAFKSFVMSVAKEGFMHATSCAAVSFGEITKIVINTEKDYLTLTSSLCALGKLGILAAEKNWDGVVLGVHGSLLQIGTALTGGSIRYKNELCRETACYCAQLEIFLEKIDMKCTPLIKPEDQKSFNEFKKLCENLKNQEPKSQNKNEFSTPSPQFNT